jgi:hypothetical protein
VHIIDPVANIAIGQGCSVREQGQADRSKAAASAEARLVNPNQATSRGQNGRLG